MYCEGDRTPLVGEPASDLESGAEIGAGPETPGRARLSRRLGGRALGVFVVAACAAAAAWALGPGAASPCAARRGLTSSHQLQGLVENFKRQSRQRENRSLQDDTDGTQVLTQGAGAKFEPLFNGLDQDGSGFIDGRTEVADMFKKAKMKSGMDKEALQQLLTDGDSDGDGKIDLEEFQGLVENFKRQSSQGEDRSLQDATNGTQVLPQGAGAKFERLFNGLDQDGSGFIDGRTEVADMFKKAKKKSGMDKEALQQLLTDGDPDGDGKINLEEFQGLLENFTQQSGQRQ